MLYPCSFACTPTLECCCEFISSLFFLPHFIKYISAKRTICYYYALDTVSGSTSFHLLERDRSLLEWCSHDKTVSLQWPNSILFQLLKEIKLFRVSVLDVRAENWGGCEWSVWMGTSWSRKGRPAAGFNNAKNSASELRAGQVGPHACHYWTLWCGLLPIGDTIHGCSLRTMCVLSPRYCALQLTPLYGSTWLL
jgi:hypothetical protein